MQPEVDGVSRLRRETSRARCAPNPSLRRRSIRSRTRPAPPNL
ncbi:hypothetical protein [Lysobacter gummosus]